MLTCEICGEEVMLEEDMKTHLLLSHLENAARCPLCSLSGVSYDELSFHISVAHPEERHEAQNPSATAAGSFIDSKAPRAASTDAEAAANALCGVAGAGSFPPPLSTPSGVAVPSTSGSPKTKQGVVTSIPVQKAAGYLLQQKSGKQKRLSSPSDGADALACPMCPVVCKDSVSLQEHVEVHLDGGAGGSDSDERLARRLHQEMEAQRREDSRLEQEEFKKLQRQFGLDGSGGYRRQMERTMERDVARGLMAPAEYHCKRVELMESLASGVDDGRTRTQGVIAALYEYYQTECRDCVHVWLSSDTDHYCCSTGDAGWGCGYRNFQMLLSSLHRLDAYASSFRDKVVPSIPRVQSMIEEAWKGGLDPQGASHFNHRLQGTRAWIGATEIYVLLTSLGISGRIIDFHQPTGPGGTHPKLFEWVRQYFSRSSRSGRLPPRLIRTSLPPLYLQHQGHSRCIVGLEQRKNGTLCLLLLDPGISSADTRKLMSRDTTSAAVRRVQKLPGSLKHAQYQLVAVEGMLSAEEKQASMVNSGTLCAERIP
ncbi:zinc finger-containing ubiquitin peptidase 1 isoform X2 [Dunckerocampus dactyliophorus]|uniref:zinc finger-containing ubiquitin peptidase 1 isoform X2 n=1 Tax=Dunckerocampus dactyliophorus TaxID=161453 RepID=UPI002405A914|nr:zinc finger-containing ubiquitin peptidase 1 isoform X2 [Dunckerocampus dactyliophorus]